MRTDIEIDRKQVWLPLPNGTIGYQKHKAQFGDIVLFKETPNHSTIGRVCGRIASGEHRGNLVVVALGHDLSFPMERWVSPSDVVECYDPLNCGPVRAGKTLAEFLAFMFGPEFKTHSTDKLRRFAAGEIVADEFII